MPFHLSTLPTREGVDREVAWVAAITAAALSLGGCGLLLDTDRDGPTDPGIRDAAGDGPTSPDAMVLDASVDVDAGRPCLGVDVTGAIAHWSFDMDPPLLVVDDLRGHDGAIVGSAYEYVTGRTDCGEALRFRSGDTTFVAIPSSPEFDLTEGSISFDVMIPEHRAFGIISRDELGVLEPGHFYMGTTDEGHLFARIQSPTDGNAYACSDTPVPLGSWLRVDFAFGGPDEMILYVAGTRQTYDGVLWFTDETDVDRVDCATNHSYGIGENTLDLVFGGTTSRVGRGAAPTTLFVGGQLDEVVLRGVRVSF